MSSGTRVERRSAIQASENGGFSASSMNSGFIGSTALATAIALGVSSSLWQCTAISISSPTASRQLRVAARHVAQLLRWSSVAAKRADGHAQHRVDAVLERGESLRHFLDALRPIAAGGLVEHVEADAVRVHRDRVAKRAAQQRADRRADDFAGQVPQRHVDAADGGDVRHVGVHQRGHVLEVNFDRQRILADQQRSSWSRCAPAPWVRWRRLRHSRSGRVGIDADQAVAGDVLDRHGPDARDLDAVQVRRGQRAVARKDPAAGNATAKRSKFVRDNRVIAALYTRVALVAHAPGVPRRHLCRRRASGRHGVETSLDTARKSACAT